MYEQNMIHKTNDMCVFYQAYFKMNNGSTYFYIPAPVLTQLSQNSPQNCIALNISKKKLCFYIVCTAALKVY